MAITASDIVHLESEDAASTGGAITASSITSGVKNNVWADVSDAERVAGGTLYRKTFWKNENATDAAAVPVLWCSDEPDNMTLRLGLGVNLAADDNYAQGNMTAWGATAKVALVSDGADTRVATIFGMDNTGTPVPVTETVTLNGASEVLSTKTYTKVWAVFLASASASRTVLAKQGSAGTTRGTIGLNEVACWLWVDASSKANGIALPDLAAGQNYGMWRKLSWIAGATATRPNSLTTKFEENS